MQDSANKIIEIELTYLARKIPAELEGIEPDSMVDIYIPEHDIYPLLRVRKRGSTCEITKKMPVSKNDFSIHTEQTIPLSEKEFLALSKSSGRLVSKNRYTVEISGKKAEIDVFQNRLEGLVLVDFEFKTTTEKNKFIAPDCCLVEVTQELFIAGGQLAGKSYQDIQAELDRFKYKPLVYRDK